MKPIQFQIGITLDEKAVETLAKLMKGVLRVKQVKRASVPNDAECDRLRQLVTASDGRMLHLEDAAQYVGLTASGLRKLVAKKELRYFQRKPHSPIMFKTDWLDEHIDKHTHAPKDEQAPPVLPRRKKRKPKTQDGLDEGRHGFRMYLFRK